MFKQLIRDFILKAKDERKEATYKQSRTKQIKKTVPKKFVLLFTIGSWLALVHGYCLEQ